MAKKPNRNAPCYCGSGKKYKNCCMGKDSSQISSKLGMIAIAVAITVGLVLLGMALTGGGSTQGCPAGTTWSADHQHCH